jgi:glycosyltransferase involved in cell wall biosynthesis
LENDPQLKYLGVLGKIELEKYIKNALLVVSGSKLPETFGLIALEALSFGKPFIGYATGAYSEIIEEGKTGFLCQNSVQFGESIDLLTQDENLREAFSQNAYLRAKTFSSASYAKKIGGIFERLTKTPKNVSIIG